jgi:hypothetical protein
MSLASPGLGRKEIPSPRRPMSRLARPLCARRREWEPYSQRYPSSSVKDPALPPMMEDCSSTTTLSPSWASRAAAPMPAYPEPMITASSMMIYVSDVQGLVHAGMHGPDLPCPAFTCRACSYNTG